MNDNVRKVFDILSVKPYEKFKIEGNGDTIYYIDEELYVHRDKEFLCSDKGLNNLINGYFKIIKMPKESKKKKLRDITEEEFKNWMNKNCSLRKDCIECIFSNVYCSTERNWINHKDS